jgi:uncharacterized membrane protein YsdA (DUF1294 family)
MAWQVYLIWLAAASLVTFVLYGWDKAKARANGWRVPEAVLHLLALAGGFLGGWFGRSLFHHKTQKISFLLVLLIATILHLWLAYWLFVKNH